MTLATTHLNNSMKRSEIWNNSGAQITPAKLEQKDGLEFIYQNFHYYRTNCKQEQFSKKLQEAEVFFLGDQHTSELHCHLNSLFIETFQNSQATLLIESPLINLNKCLLEQQLKQVIIFEPTVTRKRKTHFESQMPRTSLAMQIMRNCLLFIFDGARLIQKFDAHVNWHIQEERCCEKIKMQLSRFSQDIEDTYFWGLLNNVKKQLHQISANECKSQQDLLKNIFEKLFINELCAFYTLYQSFLSSQHMHQMGIAIASQLIEAYQNKRKPLFVCGGIDHFAPILKEDQEAVEEMFNQLDEHHITYMVLEPRSGVRKIESRQIMEAWVPEEIPIEEIKNSFHSVVLNQVNDRELRDLGIEGIDLAALSDEDMQDLVKLKYLNYFCDPAIENLKEVYEFFAIVETVYQISQHLIQSSFCSKKS